MDVGDPASVPPLAHTPVALGDTVRGEQRHGIRRTFVLQEIDQHNRADVSRAVPSAEADNQVVVARHVVSLIKDAGRGDVVSVDFLTATSIRAHGPQRLDRAGALVYIFPAIVDEAPVVHHGRTEFAQRPLRKLVQARSVRIDAIQIGDRQAMSAAEDAALAARRCENHPAIGQVAGMHIVGPVTVAAGVFLQLISRTGGVSVDTFLFIIWRTGHLPQMGPIDIDFVDPKSLRPWRLITEQDPACIK